mgnify:CR=1 FL=1
MTSLSMSPEIVISRYNILNIFQVKTNKAVHFALATSNLDSFIQHLINLKIEFSDWKNTINKDYVRKDGIQQFYFQDPNGYWIEINNAV